tara:strand:- start:36506 stop:37288 length:783 start_codon:yes stop_codon:yes gene_type:complete
MEELDVLQLPDDGPIALIDGDSLLYYEMGKPTLEEAIRGLNNRLFHILSMCGTSRYAGFLTLSKCFRYDVAETKSYKHNRKGGSKPPIFYALREYIQQEWKFEHEKGLEADDLVAVHSKPNGTIICSPDKDVLYQCAGTHYNFRTAEFIKTSKLEANRFLWKQTLMGDATDGITGIPKLGPKTADNLLKKVRSGFEKIVIEKYVEKFGYYEGVCKFAETFKLVYILKTYEQVENVIGINLSGSLSVNDIKHLNITYVDKI